MKASFSEFSYGFALAFEIMSAISPAARGVPFFPSLQQEASLGYDVNFTTAGWPLFLQFKLADYMTRRAKYAPIYGGRPFFRVAAHRRKDSNQHNLLKRLAMLESEVYYVAPAFYRQREFTRFFVDGEVFTKTAFIPLQILPSQMDDDQHYITYETSSMPLGVRWHTDEGEFYHHPITSKAWLEHISQIMSQPRALGLPYLYKLREILHHIIDEAPLQRSLFDEEQIAKQQRDETALLIQELRYLLATLGIVLIFLQRPSL